MNKRILLTYAPIITSYTEPLGLNIGKRTRFGVTKGVAATNDQNWRVLNKDGFEGLGFAIPGST